MHVTNLYPRADEGGINPRSVWHPYANPYDDADGFFDLFIRCGLARFWFWVRNTRAHTLSNLLLINSSRTRARAFVRL